MLQKKGKNDPAWNDKSSTDLSVIDSYLKKYPILHNVNDDSQYQYICRDK